MVSYDYWYHLPLNHMIIPLSIYFIIERESSSRNKIHILDFCRFDASDLAIKYKTVFHSRASSIRLILIKMFRSCDTIWRHRSGSTLALLMACCPIAPSHYLNQYWLTISGVLCHSFENNFAENDPNINPWYEVQNYQFKITTIYLRVRWVKTTMTMTSTCVISHERYLPFCL